MTGAIVGYRRVSTTDQSLGRQDLGSVDRLFDEKLSGKDRDRPELQACLAYLREGDTLRVHSADRLARSLKDLLTILDDLTARGVRVELLKERMVFDPADPDPYRRALVQVMGAFAELERSLILSRQAEGIAIAKQNGVYKGRQPALTRDEVVSARERRALGVPVLRLARDHGVSKGTMMAALAGTGAYA